MKLVIEGKMSAKWPGKCKCHTIRAGAPQGIPCKRRIKEKDPISKVVRYPTEESEESDKYVWCAEECARVIATQSWDPQKAHRKYLQSMGVLEEETSLMEMDPQWVYAQMDALIKGRKETDMSDWAHEDDLIPDAESTLWPRTS